MTPAYHDLYFKVMEAPVAYRIIIIALLSLAMITTKIEIDRLEFKANSHYQLRQIQGFERRHHQSFYRIEDSSEPVPLDKDLFILPKDPTTFDL